MSLLSEFNAIKKKKDRIIEKNAVNLYRKLVKATPVGNPKLWKDPSQAPKGYAGGNLRGAWERKKTIDGWLITNPVKYASVRLRKREIIKGKMYGSYRFPDGIEPILQLARKKLQQELKDI